MDEQFREGLAEALQLPVSSISEDTQLPEDWESVALLTTISLIDYHYKVTVSGSDLEACRTVGDIVRLGESPSSR